MKGGKACNGCLPSRRGRCGNPVRISADSSNSSTPCSPPPPERALVELNSPPSPSSPSLPLLLSPAVRLRSSLSPALPHTCRCACGRPDDVQMVQCRGPRKEWFHYSCAGLPSVSNTNWLCLHCSIHLRHHVRVVRHIPKEACIQVAVALFQCLVDCYGV